MSYNIQPKSYDEIWGEPGHVTPHSWMVPYSVTIRHHNGSKETLSVKMMSHDEWDERVKRVTALRHGLDESEFDLISYEVNE